MAELPNTGSNVPEVGKTYQYNGQAVTVTGLDDKSPGRPRKDGLPKRVRYEADGGLTGGTARMADWLKGAQP